MPEESNSNKFLIPLMCFIEERGGATLIPQDTIDRTWDKIKEVKDRNEDLMVGFHAVPGGVLIANLLGNDAIAAWTGTDRAEEKTSEKSKDPDREGDPP